jgi:hypothetical protein
MANEFRTRLEESMTFAKRLTLVFAFAVTSFLACSAQEISVTFTLSQPTSFDGRVLPAGSYKLQTFNQGTLIARIASTDNQGQSMLVVPQSRDFEATCTKSSLHLTSTSGQWSATSVCLADSDLTLYFRESPAKPTVAAALAKTY